ncbi:MAG: polysaccharide biosynthesis protein [Ferruginibacter sp.]|nr:polysaccharide biosynthesis protein [Ferruginibacter sp.]
MKELVDKISKVAKSDRAVTWVKLISITGGAQLIVQAIGLISGIIVIRLLSTEQYGLYTLANTMLGTMVILADGGISTGVMAQGGKVWKNKTEMGLVLATGLDLRKKFAIGSLLVAIPFLIMLLMRHGASWVYAVLVVLALIPAFVSALSGTLLQIVPRLNQDIIPLQRNNLIYNVARLASISSLLLFPYAFVAILAAGLPQIWANFDLRKITAKYAHRSDTADPLIRKEILNFVKRILPGSIYFCVSSQITIWLISIFGSSTGVAQIGALGRLAIILSIFNILFSTLISPRFARLEARFDILIKRFFQIQLVVLVVGCIIVLLVSIFSTQILWVLGKEYQSLHAELVLNMIGSCIGLLAGISFGLFTCRGWILHPAISIPVSLVSIIIGVIFFDVSSLTGVLYLNIYLAVVQMLLNGGYCLIKIYSLRRQELQGANVKSE